MCGNDQGMKVRIRYNNLYTCCHESCCEHADTSIDEREMSQMRDVCERLLSGQNVRCAEKSLCIGVVYVCGSLFVAA